MSEESPKPTQPEISLDQAMAVIAAHEASKSRTYEDGVLEGKELGRAEAKAEAEPVIKSLTDGLKRVASKASDFADVHSNSQAGRALKQIVGDVSKILPKKK